LFRHGSFLLDEVGKWMTQIHRLMSAVLNPQGPFVLIVYGSYAESPSGLDVPQISRVAKNLASPKGGDARLTAGSTKISPIVLN